ncbi:MAG: M28 family peptidase [Gemmatimonadota bacterium]|nr:M28 family peptidase [Gemmatimonadota bacterium]
MSGTARTVALTAAAILGASAPLAAQMATPAHGGSEAAAAAAASITPQDLSLHLGVLAHDSMRGRDTPSPELMATARYVADRFAAAGLAPGAGDSFLQMYPISTVRPGAAEAQRLELIGPSGTVALAPGDEWFPMHDAASAAGEGALVAVDPAAAAPAELAGRVAVVRADASNLRQVLGGGLAAALRDADPAGVLVVLDMPEAFFARLRGFLSGSRATLGDLPEEGPPAAFVAASALPADLAAALDAPADLAGWSASLASEAAVSVVEAPNTVGILEGSDPELRDEYVLFTAHMDHVGVGSPVDGDSIYNGADDNASGTVTIVELAEAFAALPERPRRSLVFATVSGEEKGLLGSRWYAENPAVPLSRTVANLNLDMVGRNWTDTIVAIGKEESSLGPLVERVAAAHAELGMAVIDDRWPEENFYSRSDHFNFARRGVPILFFFNGTHEDYHRPSDEPEKIGYEKMARIGRLLFWVGLEVANADEPPAWDPEARERIVDLPAG